MRPSACIAYALVLFGCGETTDSSSPPTAIPDAGIADAASEANTDADANSPAPGRSLFDGVDFAGWDRYLGIPNGESTPLGLDNDPKQVFSIVTMDGEPAIHITGEVWGALTSKEEFSDFELRLQYKWGTLFWPPLNAFDSGVMVLSTGPFGAVNAGGDALSNPIGSGSFMVSIEYQLAPNNIGGLYNLGPIAKQAAPTTVRAERPGKWNDVRIVVSGASSQHFLNDELVTGASAYELRLPDQPAVPLERGKIQLQSEGSEIYFRHIEVRPLD